MAIYEFGDFALDVEQHQLLRGAERVAVPHKVFEILQLLVEASGRVVDRETFFARLWPDTVVEERNLTVHIHTLRKALHDSSGTEYIETIPKVGYRLVVPVHQRPLPSGGTDGRAGEAAPDLPESLAAPVAWVSRRQWHVGVRAAFLVGGLVAVLSVGAASFLSDSTAAPTPRDEVTRVAVLPFTVVSDVPDDAGLGLGLTDAIISTLDATGVLEVRPTSAVLPFLNGGDPVAAGKSLDVHHVVEGIVQRVGGRAQVSSRIVDVATGAIAWSDKFQRPDHGFFELQDAVAAGVAGLFMRRMHVEHTWTRNPSRPATPDAYRAYLQARMHMHQLWRPQAADDAIRFFRRAIALDAGFAPAYSGLARAYRVKSSHRDADSQALVDLAWRAVRKALQLDPELPEASTALGILNYNFAFDWVEAERHLRRAVDLDPDNEDAVSWLANFLRAQGRYDESIALFERARTINPLGGQHVRMLGEAYWYAGRIEEALGMLDHSTRLNPQDQAAYWLRAAVFDSAGRLSEAVAARETAARVSGDDTLLAGLLAARDRGHAAVVEYELGVRRQQQNLWEVASLLALLGRPDDALDALEQCIAMYCPNAPILIGEPRLRSLHAHPRFRALAVRANLAHLLQ